MAEASMAMMLAKIGVAASACLAGAVVTMLAGCGLGDQTDNERCPEYEPVPATPVAVVDIAGIDAFERGPRALNGDDEQYSVIGSDAPVAAPDLLLSVTAATVHAEAHAKEPALTRRLSCIGPDGPSVESKTRLSDVTLTSDADWDASTPAGSDLAVSVVDAAYLLPLQVDWLNDYLQSARFSTALRNDSAGGDAMPLLADYLRDEPLAPFVLLLQPGAPDAERRHRFTVTYQTLDGDTFTATSDPVTITPARPPPSVDRLEGTAWRLLTYSALAADGALTEFSAPADGIGGIEFDRAALQMVVRGGNTACEFNIRIAGDALELLGPDRSQPYDPERQGCSHVTPGSTDLQRFLDRFFDSTAFGLDIDPDERLTVTAPNGERLQLQAVR